jgi:hypothetical protein
MADANDWARAITGEGEQQGEVKGRNDGEYIIFSTPEKLQAGATGGLFVWHNGTVAQIAEQGGETAAISASGSDIFFSSPDQLVQQDSDNLLDFYDARVDGGFPAPVEPSCQPESNGGCQGPASQQPAFGTASSSLFAAAGNLAPPAAGVLGVQVAKPKPLTRAQLLAKALKTCKTKPKKKRAACESQARKKYGAKTKAKPKAKKSSRRGK